VHSMQGTNSNFRRRGKTNKETDGTWQRQCISSDVGVVYFNGTHGLPQDFAKANELCLRAGELGCAKAYFNLGFA